eukprot:8204148-Alexandrium_andersonii.AAC.1
MPTSSVSSSPASSPTPTQQTRWAGAPMVLCPPGTVASGCSGSAACWGTAFPGRCRRPRASSWARMPLERWA